MIRLDPATVREALANLPPRRTSHRRRFAYLKRGSKWVVLDLTQIGPDSLPLIIGVRSTLRSAKARADASLYIG